MRWLFRSVGISTSSYISEHCTKLRHIDHAAKMHELPDEYLSDAMPVAKKIALAQGVENYNILQVGFVAPHV
jgi:diadenosine tetraphosphate (Ap4A) HIT family hydrolase